MKKQQTNGLPKMVKELIIDLKTLIVRNVDLCILMTAVFGFAMMVVKTGITLNSSRSDITVANF